MFSILLIAIGIAVLVVGKRLAVLGAAIGALLGVALLRWIPGSSGPLITLGVPIGLALLGFFAAGFAKGIVNIVLIVLGALAGVAITLAFLDLFGINTGLFDWLLALVGGVIGIIVVQRFKDWALIVLAGLIGGLLVTRGLTDWLPFLAGVGGTLLALVLAGASIAYQGGFFGKRKA
jgi:hypothetical protein